MSDKSTAKAMFASLCANYEGSKKVREAKATMLIHQYELFMMKDDETIDAMHSRFQTLVYGLQILKKSYVASDHVSKILRSLLARWRIKVIAIDEAKDLRNLSVKDLISSLKVHEITLDEHDSAEESKSTALKSKGKQSHAFKANESEEEFFDQDSDVVPAVVEKMAMLSNKLQYLAGKNKKFLSRSSGYKGSRKEYQKGCIHCKKLEPFIDDCPDLQGKNQKRSPRNQLSNPTSSEKRSSRVLWPPGKIWIVN